MRTTKIEWANAVWNPVHGCTKVSPACQNCYAERMAERLRGRHGYPADEPFRVTLRPDRLEEPLRWRKPRRIFVCSMGDLFHEDVPDSFLDQVFGVMALAAFIRRCRDIRCLHDGCEKLDPLLEHKFLVLTKRPARARDYLLDEERMDRIVEGAAETWSFNDYAFDGRELPLPNLWLGVTVEDQARADERIPILLDTPAAKRFVSCEPLLGAVDLGTADALPIYREAEVVRERAMPSGDWHDRPGRGLCRHDGSLHPWLDWVIAGGESGPGARSSHPDWFRSLRDQCQTAGVPFLFKQWGAWAPAADVDVCHPLLSRESGDPRRADLGPTEDSTGIMLRVGKKAAGRQLDGRTWEEVPE